MSGARRTLRFDQLDHQAFHDAPDLIELRTAAALFVFRVFRFLEILAQRHARQRPGPEPPRSHSEPPIDCQVFQRFGLRAEPAQHIARRLARFLPVVQESFSPQCGVKTLELCG